MTHELTQPTKEMLDAGVEDLLQQVPGLEDDLGDDELQDVVCFVWQAMLGKAPANHQIQAYAQPVDPLANVRDIPASAFGKPGTLSEKPAAYLHTMHQESEQHRVTVTPYPENPFGVPGQDYSPGYEVTSEPLYKNAQPAVVPSAMTPIVEDGETIAYELNGERFSTIVGSAWNTCRAAMLHSLGNSEQLELVSDPHTFPSEMTPEMMRAVQLNSELGAYVAANLSGAYGLFAEFWKVACLAAGKSPAITDEARLISSTDCLRICQPVTPDVRVANKVRAGGFGYLRVTQGNYGKLQVDFDRFIFDQGSAPETGKFIPKHMFQGIINRLQEHCDELTEEPLVNILDGLCERYKAPDGAKDPE